MPKTGGGGTSGNLAIGTLPETERVSIERERDHISLEPGQVAEPPDRPLGQPCPRGGIAAMVSPMIDGAIGDVATTGREGMAAFEVIGGRLARTVFVQGIGEVDRMAVAWFPQLSGRFSAPGRTLPCHAAAPVARRSACNRFHPSAAHGACR